MEFGDLIRKRYSVRRYHSKPVEEEKLIKVLESACLAPTAANKQPFKFIVIKTKDKEEELKNIPCRMVFRSTTSDMCM
jgi:nitroreductase